MRTINSKSARLTACAAIAAASLSFAAVANGQSSDIVGPTGSVAFGREVKVLPNGNIVVADPQFTPAGATYPIGAVYLYSPLGALISTTRGSLPYDNVGNGGIHVVGDGNFVICSPDWQLDGIGFDGEGAATWVNGTTGLDAEVSASNSLIGTGDSRFICRGGVTTLKNGDYVVSSPWASGATFSGAATWCSGNGGCIGPVNETNSLVSHHGALDSTVVPLSNGGYVVANPFWRDDNAAQVGAVTRCVDAGGCTGFISASNSLVGSTDIDLIGSPTASGYPSVIALADGGFVVKSTSWQGAGGVRIGAITYVPASGLIGPVSTANSLVGTTLGDLLDSTISALPNGGYVVNAPGWDRGGIVDAGASTLCTAGVGCVGTITAGTSFVGTSAHDQVGSQPATALSNGNYVITSRWAVAGVLTGAVTWCNGTVGCIGEPSIANSLVSVPGELAGMSVTALTNGHYVVDSTWHDGASANLGAATWCDGAVGCVGTVSASSSLVGATAFDELGGAQASIALANGNYAVTTNQWHLGGAITGAVTWGNGRGGLSGPVSADNSFIGTASDMSLGNPFLIPLANGDFVVWSKSRSTPTLHYAGSMTLLRGNTMQTGTIDSTNSVIGNVADQGPNLAFDYDAGRDTLVVGKPAEDIVTLLRIDRLFSGNFD